MKKCAICGCTENAACMTDAGPCAWSTISLPDIPICTGCEEIAGEILARGIAATEPVPGCDSLVLSGQALRDIIGERMEQIHTHGRTIEHDQQTNRPRDLPLAGASYVNAAIDQLTGEPIVAQADPETWPWDPQFWRPRDTRQNLVKAAALIWAAIDRLDHAPRDAGDVA